MSKDYKSEKALIFCHPGMKMHLAEQSKDRMLPDEMFVLSTLIDPDYALVVSAEEFMEFIDTHNHGKWKIRKETRMDIYNRWKKKMKQEANAQIQAAIELLRSNGYTVTEEVK